MALPKFAGAALTRELKKLASEVVAEVEGTPLTREQLLAQMIWRQALGWTEVTTDNNGNRKEVYHPATQWAQTLVFERLEGKAAAAADPQAGEQVKAADKVRELARQRINQLAGA